MTQTESPIQNRKGDAMAKNKKPAKPKRLSPAAKRRIASARTNVNALRLVSVLVICATLTVANILYTMASKTHIWSQTPVLQTAIRSSVVNRTLEGKRGTIYDRNHQVLAQETPAWTLVALIDNRTDEEKAIAEAETERSDAARLQAARENGNEAEVQKKIDEEHKKAELQYVKSPVSFARQVKSVLGDVIDSKNVSDLIVDATAKGRSQTELGLGTKRLDRETKEKLEELQIPGLTFIETTNRTYPSTPFASNLIGFAAYSEDSNNISGVLGLEKSMDSYLGSTNGLIQYQQTMNGQVLPGTTKILKNSEDGDDVTLTLDSNLQQLVEQQLQDIMVENEAKSAWCVVMEVETGKILAWSSYPTFDQNTHMEVPVYTNLISEVPYEPGSVIKPFVYATAIDTGVYPTNATYRAGTFVYDVDPYTQKITRLDNADKSTYPAINDAEGTDWGTLTFEDGLAHSSNIAVCELLTHYINPDKFSKYMDAFGFYQPVDIPYVSESQVGTKNMERATDYLSSGFGQASSITILQLCQAYTALFNDGVMMQPYVVESITDPGTGKVLEKHEPTVAGTPISAETSRQIRDLMHHVMDPGMTGEDYVMDDVDLIGKTGTGEIYDPETGKYSPYTYTSSAMLAAPYSDPKIMVYMGMVSNRYYGFSKAPFQTIMRQALLANSVNGGTSESTTESGYEKWESYEMPSLINHSLDFANSKMESKKVNTVIIGDGSTVISQFPKAGTTINSNDNVLLMTDGSSITMPDVIGWTRKDLTALWELTGISIQCDGYGKVTWQSIEPGTLIQTDTEISVMLE